MPLAVFQSAPIHATIIGDPYSGKVDTAPLGQLDLVGGGGAEWKVFEFQDAAGNPVMVGDLEIQNESVNNLLVRFDATTFPASSGGGPTGTRHTYCDEQVASGETRQWFIECQRVAIRNRGAAVCKYEDSGDAAYDKDLWVRGRPSE